jgi:glucosamine 6-phosphate synthetase-like amidotransferase/phosphosugar isomerase protein
MCGLVGLAGKLEYKDERLMKSLLTLDYVRGQDATGFASVTKQDGDVHIAKIPSHPFDLFDMAAFRAALSGHQSKVFMGHNRAATRGHKNKANAHPFEHGDILGAHNGTLEFNEWRDLEDAVGMKFGTDSEAIIAGINKLGVKDTIEMIRGAWSLVWYNKRENTLNFIRNKDRPMHLAYTKEYDKILWSSAWEILQASYIMTDGHSAWTDLHHEDSKEQKGLTYFPTDPDVHYTFDLEEVMKGGKKKPKPRAKKIEGKPEEVRKPYNSPFVNQDLGIDPNLPMLGPPANSPKKSGQTSVGSDRVHDKVVNLFANQPFAEWISHEKFSELNRHGCSWCGSNDYEWEDAGWIVIENGDFIICPECTKERHGNRVYTSVEPYLA